MKLRYFYIPLSCSFYRDTRITETEWNPFPQRKQYLSRRSFVERCEGSSGIAWGKDYRGKDILMGSQETKCTQIVGFREFVRRQFQNSFSHRAQRSLLFWENATIHSDFIHNNTKTISFIRIENRNFSLSHGKNLTADMLQKDLVMHRKIG